MSKLKLVIFDCDGVMFDSKEANRFYYNHLLGHFGLPPMSEDDLDFVHTHQVTDSVAHIFRHQPEKTALANQYRHQVDYGRFIPYMIIAPDLKEFLTHIRPSCRTAISTNRTTTMPAVLQTFGLGSSFDLVVTALDVDNPKPHPEALHKILAHFGVGVEAAVFIGDSMIDREHTAAVGMRLIAYRSPDLPAEHHVRDFMEIPAINSLW